jgi:hypothetical protein
MLLISVILVVFVLAIVSQPSDGANLRLIHGSLTERRLKEAHDLHTVVLERASIFREMARERLKAAVTPHNLNLGRRSATSDSSGPGGLGRALDAVGTDVDGADSGTSNAGLNLGGLLNGLAGNLGSESSLNGATSGSVTAGENDTSGPTDIVAGLGNLGSGLANGLGNVLGGASSSLGGLGSILNGLIGSSSGATYVRITVHDNFDCSADIMMQAMYGTNICMAIHADSGSGAGAQSMMFTYNGFLMAAEMFIDHMCQESMGSIPISAVSSLISSCNTGIAVDVSSSPFSPPSGHGELICQYVNLGDCTAGTPIQSLWVSVNHADALSTIDVDDAVKMLVAYVGSPQQCVGSDIVDQSTLGTNFNASVYFSLSSTYN